VPAIANAERKSRRVTRQRRYSKCGICRLIINDRDIDSRVCRVEPNTDDSAGIIDTVRNLEVAAV